MTRVEQEPRRPLGGFQLTRKALVALGYRPTVEVPLVLIPWRPDRKDRRR